MLELGLHYDQGPILLKSIAKLENISEKYLSQIVIPLKNAGLLNSFRGARGGYVLARHPAQIRMREVVEVLEGGISLVDCLKRPQTCTRIAGCVTRTLWDEIGKKIIKILENYTIADLVDECRNKNCKSIVYSI